MLCVCVSLLLSFYFPQEERQARSNGLLCSSPSLAPSEGKKREPGNEFGETEENSHCSRN